MADDRNRWNDEALNQLAKRVDGMATSLDEFRVETNRCLRALTRKKKNGKLEPRPGKVDFMTWILFMSGVVLPVVAILLAKS